MTSLCKPRRRVVRKRQSRRISGRKSDPDSGFTTTKGQRPTASVKNSTNIIHLTDGVALEAPLPQRVRRRRAAASSDGVNADTINVRRREACQNRDAAAGEQKGHGRRLTDPRGARSRVARIACGSLWSANGDGSWMRSRAVLGAVPERRERRGNLRATGMHLRRRSRRGRAGGDPRACRAITRAAWRPVREYNPSVVRAYCSSTGSCKCEWLQPPHEPCNVLKCDRQCRMDSRKPLMNARCAPQRLLQVHLSGGLRRRRVQATVYSRVVFTPNKR
ncbi:hypothetical protein MTO96_002058 [Rhipicephalus appendiculatus]